MHRLNAFRQRSFIHVHLRVEINEWNLEVSYAPAAKKEYKKCRENKNKSKTYALYYKRVHPHSRQAALDSHQLIVILYDLRGSQRLNFELYWPLSKSLHQFHNRLNALTQQHQNLHPRTISKFTFSIFSGGAAIHACTHISSKAIKLADLTWMSNYNYNTSGGIIWADNCYILIMRCHRSHFSLANIQQT